MYRSVLVAAVVLLSAVHAAHALSVTSSTPAHGSYDIPRDASVSLHFDDAFNTSTLNSDSFKVWGEQTGYYPSSYTTNPPTADPVSIFKPGERIVVMLNTNLLDTNGLSATALTFEFFASADLGCTCSVSFVTNQFIGYRDSESVALGDLDGDGDLDAIVGNGSIDTATNLSATWSMKIKAMDSSYFVSTSAPIVRSLSD